MIGGPSHGARSPLLSLAREITLTHAADTVSASALGDTPRHRFLAAVLRLEGAGFEAAAVCRRIYSRSDLADEFATPDAVAAGRIIRILNSLEPSDARSLAAAREGIGAVCDILCPPLGDA